MAYLPGVPDVGPAPVNPVRGNSKSTIGSPTGISAVAHSVGKPGQVEHLGSIVGRRGAGITAIGGGDTAMHSLGHYGKKPPPLLGGPQITGGNDPTAHPGATMIRGGLGTQSRHIRSGGLGPEKMGRPGPSNTDYSLQQNEDSE